MRSFCTLRLLALAVLGFSAHPMLLCQTATSNQITGVVTDQTGAAIVSAEVVFTNGSLVARQVTDDRGEFVFSQISAESGVLKVSATGFQVRSIDWPSSDRRSLDQHTGVGPLQIVLLPATAAQQITVAANRTGVRVIENATSVTILSSPDLDATAAFRVDDILRQVPGFSLFRRTTSRTANPTTQGVSLRGLGASGASRALCWTTASLLTIHSVAGSTGTALPA